MISGIYKITSPSGKVYIGQSKDIKTRWRDYKYSKTQPLIVRSFEKYGMENHIFEIIEECCVDSLNSREFFWQEYYDVLGPNGLNCFIVDLDSKKTIYSEETKRKMSESQRGIKNHRYGKKLTKEQIEKLSKANKGRVVSEKSKEKRRKTIGDRQKGSGNPRAKKVICTITKMTFGCIKDCAEYLNMNRKTLNDQLIGRYPNKTTFVLLENFNNESICTK
jgi:group I intron endonuclease